MRPQIEKYIKGAKGADRGDLDLTRPSDAMALAAAAVAFAAALIYVIYIGLTDPDGAGAVPWLALPFFACGAIYHLRTRFWVLIVIAAASAVIWFLDMPSYVLLAVLFASVAIPGTVYFAEAIQRRMFYAVLRAVEYCCVRPPATVAEKAAVFAFRVPENVDSRNMAIEQSGRRGGMPWKDVRRTVALGLVFGMFIWIYLSLNPSMLGAGAAENAVAAHISVLTLSLYIPAIVIPWSVFRSLDARVETNCRDYRFYDGVVSTIKAMALPTAAAFLLVFIFAGPVDYPSLLYYMLFSAIASAAVAAAAAIVYHVLFEAELVNDIISEWRIFRPAPLLAPLEERVGRSAEDVPGTPERNLGDFGKLILPGNR
ncbi:MAG: hypothetical protein LBT41_05795 [Candidatus Methanoplasma sp.]|jgi:hypothetical protein|nr:hypothetical protein [Candidatus Methanoplasma sp.]